jgi:serine/threonine protein phosphatase PrpC
MKPAASSPKASTLSWRSHGITNVGRVRKLNEDALLERPEMGLWLVADGMGGHSAGEVASQMIVDNLKKVHEGITLDRFIDDVEDKLLKVNEKLLEKSRETTKRNTIGSTVVVFIAYQNYCVYMWAGDSRLYRLRDGRLRQMTTDHSQVELYVEQGLISREEAQVHPHGNMITRAVGATDELFLDMDIQTMHHGDRYLLCSDGLTKHLVDFEIEDILGDNTGTEETCKDLVDLTLERGAGDNVTAIVVDVT